MLELLNYSFMQRAFLAGGVVGLVCSLLGVFVVLRGLSFIGAGISHAAFAGVALGLLLGVPPIFSAFVFCSLIAVAIGYASRVGKIKEDTSIGIFFAASMAFGVLLIGLLKNQNVDLLSYLFGGILTLSGYDLYVSLILGICVLLCIALLYKEMVSVVFDEELARISGVPSSLIIYLLLILMALAVVVSMTLVGIILVSALIVTPAATALQLVKDVDKAMWVSGVLGVLSTESGLVLSYYLNTAPGPTIVLLSTLGFLAAVLFRKLWRSSSGSA